MLFFLSVDNSSTYPPHQSFTVVAFSLEIPTRGLGDARAGDQTQGPVHQIADVGSHQQGPLDVLRPARQLQRRGALVRHETYLRASGKEKREIVCCLLRCCITVGACIRTVSFYLLLYGFVPSILHFLCGHFLTSMNLFSSIILFSFIG